MDIKQFLVTHWADIVGVAGFVLSLYLAVSAAINNRCKLNLIIDGFMCNSIYKGYVCTLSATFENCSRQSIAISSIALMQDGQECKCRTNAQEIVRKKEGSGVYSCQFPVNLPPLGSEHGFLLLFLNPQGQADFSKPQTFVIHTNRGKVVKTIQRLDTVLRPPEEFAPENF